MIGTVILSPSAVGKPELLHVATRRSQDDGIAVLARRITKGVWKHDAHLLPEASAQQQAGMVGPSETVLLVDGQLGLSLWQTIFFCEFDGPRQQRSVVLAVNMGPFLLAAGSGGSPVAGCARSLGEAGLSLRPGPERPAAG